MAAAPFSCRCALPKAGAATPEKRPKIRVVQMLSKKVFFLSVPGTSVSGFSDSSCGISIYYWGNTFSSSLNVIQAEQRIPSVIPLKFPAKKFPLPPPSPKIYLPNIPVPPASVQLERLLVGRSPRQVILTCSVTPREGPPPSDPSSSSSPLPRLILILPSPALLPLVP